MFGTYNNNIMKHFMGKFEVCSINITDFSGMNFWRYKLECSTTTILSLELVLEFEVVDSESDICLSCSIYNFVFSFQNLENFLIF